MTKLTVKLDHPIEGSGGLLKEVVFAKQPAAKHLIAHGSFLDTKGAIKWDVLSQYINDLTDLDFSEIERLNQLDFANIGQQLADWVYLDEKK